MWWLHDYSPTALKVYDVTSDSFRIDTGSTPDKEAIACAGNDVSFQAAYDLPLYNIDISLVFGVGNYEVLSATQIDIENDVIDALWLKGDQKAS